MTRTSPRLTGGLMATLALLVTACGISVTEPRALPQEGHEDLLLGTSTTSTTAPTDGDRIRLFFIGQDDKLESVLRPYEERPRVNTLLADLEENPLEDEQVFDQFGPIQTFVPPGLEATLVPRDSIETAAGIRVISVHPEADLRGTVETDTRLATLIARQLVCTFLHLTLVDDDGDGESEDVVGVEIHDDQGPIQLTDDDGQLITGAVVLEHFGNCKTGTEERKELLDEAEETTTTTSATTTSSADSPTSADPG